MTRSILNMLCSVLCWLAFCSSVWSSLVLLYMAYDPMFVGQHTLRFVLLFGFVYFVGMVGFFGYIVPNMLSDLVRIINSEHVQI